MELLMFDQAHWNWVSLAIILLVFEVVSFTAVLIWFSVAAFLTGIIIYLTGFGLSVQLVLFSVFTIAGLVFSKKYLKVSTDEDSADINKGPGKHIGKVVSVSQDFENGRGRVKLGDTSWRAKGPECKVGDKVKIIGADSGTLEVELVEERE